MTQNLPALIKGLYSITPDEPDTATLIRKTRLALQGGTKMLQYRNKTATVELKLGQAIALRELTQEFGVVFIINDDVNLAKMVNADGVHLGTQDADIGVARALLGREKIVGVSCYNQLELAKNAAQKGADYVAFGAFFPSSVKPNAVVASLTLLQNARLQLKLPIVAIGGITPENGTDLLNAGADALAVISAVFEAEDIQQAARRFSALMN